MKRQNNIQEGGGERKHEAAGLATFAALGPAVAAIAGLILLSACSVGPKYHAPTAQAPPAYKELTPENFKDTEGWKVAQPLDSEIRGKWWEMLNDPELNALEEQVNISNQNIAAAAAGFAVTQALVKEVRSQFFPTGTTALSITRSRQPSRGGQSGSAVNTDSSNYSLPFDATWVPDLWGRIRSNVGASVYGAQVSAADLENARLSAHGAVAVAFFQIRALDAQKELFDSSIVAYQQSLALTQARFDTGISSDEDVAQAETQMETTQAQDTDLGVQRAQLEHAVALLVGRSPAEFSIPVKPLKANPPAIPFGLPSQLLERRPDIAAAERLMAQANAQIGIARAAFFPTVTLSASGGFGSLAIADWLTWPGRIWSVGPAVAETIFDAGLRRATMEQYRAVYDQAVANYRETVLTAFEQVENNLASLRILSVEAAQQETAVRSSQRNLTIATDRYRFGLDPYLNVITAQATLLSNQRALVNVRTLQMSASVQLIEALGGGWNRSQLPSHDDLVKTAPEFHGIPY